MTSSVLYYVPKGCVLLSVKYWYLFFFSIEEWTELPAFVNKVAALNQYVFLTFVLI